MLRKPDRDEAFKVGIRGVRRRPPACAQSSEPRRRYLKEASKRLVALQEIARALAMTRSPEDLAAVVPRAVASSLGAEAGSVRLLNPERSHLMRIFPADCDKHQPLVMYDVPLDDSCVHPIVDAVRTGEMIRLESPDDGLARYPAIMRTALDRGYQALAALPLQVDGVALGSFSLYFAQAHKFEREERDFLWAVAGLAAQALERARLYASEQARSQELDRQQQYYRALVEQSTDLVLLVTSEGTIRYASPSHERVLGLRVQDLAGTSVTSFVDPKDMACLGEALDAVRCAGGIMRLGEFRVRHADGTERTLEMFANNRLADPAVGGIILNNRDVTERKRTEILLEHQAFHDALTELPNRTLLNERLNHLLRNAGRHRTSFSLFLLDLDHFKEVNDTLGHRCGDLLLKEVATRLVCTMHASDTVARLGGDEFAILCPLLSVNDAITVARHMLEALAVPWSVQGYQVGIAGSIGIAIFPAHGCEASVLLAHADRAMYAAKEVGAGYALYNAALERTHRRRMLPAASAVSLDSHDRR